MAARPDSVAESVAGVVARLGAPAADVRATAALAQNCAAGEEGSRERAALPLLAFVAGLLGRLALEQRWRRPQLSKLVRLLAEASGLPSDVVRRELHGRIARDPHLLELSPAVAVETQLRMFYGLVPVDEVSLWTTGQLDKLTCSSHLGSASPQRRARAAAFRVLRAGRAHVSSGRLHAVAVLRWQRAHAALVISASGDDVQLALDAARDTAAALAPILEREALLATNATRERALAGEGERLLTRLGFDLHDGPIQGVAALASDVHLFRQQLLGAVEESSLPEALLGRVDDLHARIVSVDDALRDMVHSLGASTAAKGPLQDVLRRELDAFASHTGIRADLSVRGDLDELSDSQRIALVRIVQESLTNVREHSGASTVTVSLAGRRSQTVVEVTDDGRGFDVERTLVRAARRGRLGLMGMSERVRLLGGRFDVDSRPGGPTTVSAILPAWRPATAQPLASEALVITA